MKPLVCPDSEISGPMSKPRPGHLVFILKSQGLIGHGLTGLG